MMLSCSSLDIFMMEKKNVSLPYFPNKGEWAWDGTNSIVFALHYVLL